MPQDHPRARLDAADQRGHRGRRAGEIAEAHDPSRASISPPLAAQIYGLEVLAEDVEVEDHNTTRFVVLSREPRRAPAGEGPVVTTFVFNVRKPAGRALQGARRLTPPTASTMTKLES